MSIALGMVHVHKQSHELRGTVVNALFGPLWFCVEPSLHCSSTIHLIPRRILITTIADLIKIKAAWSVIFIMRVTYPDRYTGEHERRDKLPYSQPPRQLDIQLLTVAQDLTQLRKKPHNNGWLICSQAIIIIAIAGLQFHLFLHQLLSAISHHWWGSGGDLESSWTDLGSVYVTIVCFPDAE